LLSRTQLFLILRSSFISDAQLFYIVAQDMQELCFG
jgi:hypothetical protein